jgi:hypothetical protein
MPAGLSKDIPHQLGSTVDDQVLIGEVWICIHIASDSQDALDPSPGSKAFAYSPQYVGCAQRRGLRGRFEADLRGNLAFADQLVAVEGDLARRIQVWPSSTSESTSLPSGVVFSSE